MSATSVPCEHSVIGLDFPRMLELFERNVLALSLKNFQSRKLLFNLEELVQREKAMCNTSIEQLAQSIQLLRTTQDQPPVKGRLHYPFNLNFMTSKDQSTPYKAQFGTDDTDYTQEVGCRFGLALVAGLVFGFLIYAIIRSVKSELHDL